MKSDEDRWDERYRTSRFPDTASDLVRDYYHLAETGRALDIAAGNGRNAAFLAEKGFQVDAVELSSVAIEQMQSRDIRINCLKADLDQFRPEPDSYELIINIHFLNRQLFPHIKRALRNNGILIFRTFLDTHFGPRPSSSSNRDHYLHPNELLHNFLPLRILFYHEEEVIWSNQEKREAANLVARKTSGFD